MGYAMRTRRYRYIEWVNFTNIVDDKPTKGHHKGGPPSANFEHPLGVELYDHTEQDTVENVAECCPDGDWLEELEPLVEELAGYQQ